MFFLDVLNVIFVFNKLQNSKLFLHCSQNICLITSFNALRGKPCPLAVTRLWPLHLISPHIPVFSLRNSVDLFLKRQERFTYFSNMKFINEMFEQILWKKLFWNSLEKIWLPRGLWGNLRSENILAYWPRPHGWRELFWDFDCRSKSVNSCQIGCGLPGLCFQQY